MKALTLYRNGVAIAVVTNVEYNGEYMGDCTISVNFKSSTPIDFKIGDYIDYRGERFVLNHIPAVKKIASKGSAGDAFTYDNVVFYTYAYELKRCKFHDYVLNDNNVHWTALPTFSFYCEDVSDLAERIQANLDRLYGQNKWSVKVDEGYTVKKDKSISVENQSCWDALQLVDSEFKTNFIIRGRNILIGGTGDVIANKFCYGIGKGLLSFEMAIDDSKELITRLRAYGNTTNMPTSYYKWVGMGYEIANLYGMYKIKDLSSDNTGKTRPQLILYYDTNLNHDASLLINDVQCYNESPKQVSNPYFTLMDDINPRIQVSYYEYVGEPTYKDGVPVYSDSKYVLKGVAQFDYCSYYEDSEKKSLVRCWVTRDDGIISWLRVLEMKYDELTFPMTKIIARSTRIFKYSFITSSDKYKKYVVNDLPFNSQNNMAVTRLMLPMFPSEKGTKLLYESEDDEYYGYKLVCNQNDVYIDCPNRNKYGTFEGSVYIDGTDNETTDEDVYPSIEKVTIGDLRNAGVDVDGNSKDVINTIVKAEVPSDDGDLDLSKVEKNSIYVWIKDIGFDINNYKSETAPTIYFKTGMCVGREFEIDSCEKSGLFYKLKLLRKTDGDINVVFPNKTFCISEGDEYVLLNIKMPDLYVKMASEKLLRLALPYLKKYSKVNYSYQPKIDNVWFWRQHQACQKFGKESLYSTIKEGDRFYVDESDDLGFSDKVRISSLKITENDSSAIPQIDITLKEDVR